MLLCVYSEHESIGTIHICITTIKLTLHCIIVQNCLFKIDIFTQTSFILINMKILVWKIFEILYFIPLLCLCSTTTRKFCQSSCTNFFFQIQMQCMDLFWCFNLPQVHMHKYITDNFPKQDCTGCAIQNCKIFKVLAKHQC